MVLQRRNFLGTGVAAVLTGLALPGWAQAPETSPYPRKRGQSTPPPRPVDAGILLQDAGLSGAVAYVLADAATGAVLEQRAPDMALPPGSVAKVFTALFALEHLGADHQFETRVLADGPLVDGIVQGDLILAGGGDPTLDTDKLGDLVAALAAKGVRGITGKFRYWEGALPLLAQIDPDQPAHVGYNPALSGLNLNFNRVNFEWKRQKGGAYAVQMDARGERFLPLVDVAAVEVVDREGPLFTYAAGTRDSWTVARAALGKGGSRWLPVRAPGRYAADVFRTLARAQGIVLPVGVSVTALPAGMLMVSHRSDPLVVILRDMLKFSTNLTAEVVGLAASRMAAPLAGGLQQSGATMTQWASTALGFGGVLVDHSGLGGASRVTAADLVRALRAAEALPQGRALRGILRDVGMKDDAGEVIKGHPVQVIGKSGTLNFSSGLAGMILPPGGRGLVYAIFCADVARRDGLALEEREDPEGGAGWTKRARRLHGRLIARWATLYG